MGTVDFVFFSAVTALVGGRNGIQPAENLLQLFLQDHDEPVVTQEKPVKQVAKVISPKAASPMHTDGLIVFARWAPIHTPV